jgi:TnsA endonuclease-like protein
MINTNISTQVTFTRGPHLIPPKRRIANEFHRIFSIKAGMRIVCVESSLEAATVYWAESIPEIIELCEQPLRIMAPIGKKPHYTFDLSLRYKSNEEIFYEVKPESSLSENSHGKFVPTNWDLIESICIDNAYKCGVLTEKDTNKKEQEIANWRRLLPYARFAYENPHPDLEAEIYNVCCDVKRSEIEKIFFQLPNFSYETLLSYIAKLIHQGTISAELGKKRLSRQTIIYVTERASANLLGDEPNE